MAISAKKVLSCHVVDGNWNGAKAAEMYTNALGPALREAYPAKKRFLLLEDNDPSGYKSTVAKDVKTGLNISTLDFPRRSPDLNPLDYGFWDCINRRLRRQEKRFRKGRKETRLELIARLRKTVLAVPETVLTPMVQSMKRRCIALEAAKGRDFEE